MMKKSIIFMLILTLVLSTFLVGCTKTEDPVDTPDVGVDTPDVDEEDDDVAVGRPSEPMGQITIGNTTELTGDWVPHWQNNAADYDVYNFMMGYSTVDMTFEGEYLVNDTVVENLETTENADGSKTFEWTIKQDLEYHDGTPITAKDYVTSVALWSSKQMGDLEAKNSAGLYFVGWKEFSQGESETFSGVRLLDDYKFSVTMAAEELPYFYELANVSVGPENLAYWTSEDVDIVDDGEGVYFTNFDALALKDHINKQRGGIYPSSGAYVLKSYDEASKTAILEINENYKGDYTGQKPSIQTIIYKKVSQETSLDELATGAVDLLTGMASGDEINAGLDLVDDGGFAFTNYPRSGYGKLTLICDFGPTKDVEVRQALTHLLDRNEFARAFTGGHGSVVNGPYGESMWFYQETRAELNEKLNQYPYSLDDAVALLEKAGWVLDKDGNDYAGEGLRHKKMDDGALEPLIIEWGSTEDNVVSELLVLQLQENPDVAKAGMKINQTLMTFGELLNYLYRDGSQDAKYGIPQFHMFNLATNFTPMYDLSTTYTSDPGMIKQGYNTNFLMDTELEGLAKEMVLKDSEDRDGFKKTFVDFIAKWNYLAPDVPLYSNIYHDFYNEKLEDYNMNSLVRVDKALLYAYVTK